MYFQKAFLVHDSWKASSAAIANLGYKAAPPVNHSKGWRDPNAGFHSNDIESEFSGLKRMVRERYGRLSFQATAMAAASSRSQNEDHDDDDVIQAGDLYEYVYRVNVGDTFDDILKALIMVSPPQA